MTTTESNSVGRRSVLRSGLGLAVGGGLGAMAGAALGTGSATAASAGQRPPAEGERFVEVPGGRVWVKVVGIGRGVPLLTLHGGPSTGHNYLTPLAALADDRPVIFYDQLGCGLSDKPDNPALWTVNRFVAELKAVRQALGLDRVHLLGHSWGAWLAIEYLQARPRGVASAVLASGSASTAEFVAGTRRLRARLPISVQETLDRYEALGDFTAPEYLAAVQVFYDSYLFRAEVVPDIVLQSMANLEGNQVYATMNGPNEFNITGNLSTWDRTARLHAIREPILLTRGKYDEFDVSCTNTLQAKLPHTERAEFARSAHLAMVEEEHAYAATVRSFLRRQDNRCPEPFPGRP